MVTNFTRNTNCGSRQETGVSERKTRGLCDLLKVSPDLLKHRLHFRRVDPNANHRCVWGALANGFFVFLIQEVEIGAVCFEKICLERRRALPDRGETRPEAAISIETQTVPVKPPELLFLAQVVIRPLYLRMVP